MISWIRVALVAACLPLLGGDIKLVHEFKSMGLMDISSDGSPLAFHQHRSTDLEKVIVKRSSDIRTVAELEVNFGFRHWLIRFIPGTHELLLNGQFVKPKTEPGYRRWNPETGTLQEVKGPDSDFEFSAFIDDRRALALLYTNPASHAIWNVFTGELTPAKDRRADPGVGAAMLLTPQERKILQNRFPSLKDRRVYNAARSASGNLVIASGPPSNSDVDPRKSEHYLGVFDFNTATPIRETRLFDDEHPEDKSGWLGQGRYVDGLLGNIAYQMAISPDGRAVAMSYERDTVPFPALLGLTQTDWST